MMALTSFYKTGKASVATGSKIVTGTNTFWVGKVWPGDLFGTHRGVGVRIEAVADAALTLAYAWPGIGQSAAAYEIQLVPDAARVQEETRILFERLKQGLFINPNEMGTLAGRAEYNARPKGFRYLRTDVTPFLIYVKNSDASGDWSGGASFVGPEGQPGTDGEDGIGDAYDLIINALGRPGAGEDFDFLFSRGVLFPAGLAGSIARVKAAPAADAVFSVLRNGSPIATVTFAAGSTSGVFAGAGAAFAAGDLLTLRTPSPRDASLGGLLFTLAGNRTH